MGKATFTPVVTARGWFYEPTATGGTQFTSGANVMYFPMGASIQVGCRFQIEETGGSDGAATDDWQLQYQIGGTGGAWNAVGTDADTDGLGISASSTVADGATVTDPGDLFGGPTTATGGYQNGVAETNSDTISNYQLLTNKYTHLLWNLHVYGDNLSGVSDGDELYLRVTRNGTEVSADYLIGTFQAYEPEVQAWRFYDDDQDEDDSTPLAAENTNITANVSGGDVHLHFRVQIKEQANNDLIVVSDWRYGLEYSYNGGAWAPVPAPGAGTVIEHYNSSYLTDSGATSNRATNGISDPASGSFVQGEVAESGTPFLRSFALDFADFTEDLFSLEVLSAGVSNGDTIDLRWACWRYYGGVPRYNIATTKVGTTAARINILVGGTTHAGSGSAAAQLDGTGTGSRLALQSGTLANQLDATSTGSRIAFFAGTLASQLDATAVGEVFAGPTTWQGTGTVAAQLDGTATGIMQFVAAGSASAQLDSAAIGATAHSGTGSAASQLDGLAVGTYLQPLVGSIPSQLDGTADGTYVRSAAGAGAAQLDGTAVGAKDIKLAGSMAAVLDGVAIGTTLQFMFGVLDSKLDTSATGAVVTVHQAIGTLIAELDTTGLGGLFLPSVIYEPFEITAGTATEIGGTFVPLAITPDPATAALTATVDDVIVNKFGSIRIWLNVE